MANGVGVSTYVLPILTQVCSEDRRTKGVWGDGIWAKLEGSNRAKSEAEADEGEQSGPSILRGAVEERIYGYRVGVRFRRSGGRGVVGS